MNNVFRILFGCVLGIGLAGMPAAANDTDAKFNAAAQTIARKFQQDEVIINAVLEQNQNSKYLDMAAIGALNAQWIAELATPKRNLINKLQNNDLSIYLHNLKQQSAGEILEMIVMDNKGLNVGQSGVTSDYWQGDEDKWLKPFVEAAGHVFVDEIRWDESVQNYEVQVSFTLFDPATQTQIGAMTVGLRVPQYPSFYAKSKRQSN